MKTANSICLFAPNSQQLVLVSVDNRIRIWSTVSNSVEHEILTNEIESNITFVNYNPSPSTKKKQEKFVVIGTEKGTIYLWNLSTARVQMKLDQSKDGHTDKITGLALSPDHSLLYSCSSDGFFCEWNLKTEQLSWKAKKTSEGYSCLESHVVDNKINVIATASTTIKTWDLQNNKNMSKKLTGHSAAVQHMKFSKDGKYLISSSKDRFVYLWNLSGDSNAPLQSFTCDGSPSLIDFNNFSKSQDYYYLLAVSENSSVNLWKYHASSSNQGKAKALKPEGKVNCSTSDILSCQFYNDSQLIVASGTAAKPKFDKVEFIGKDGDLIKLSEVSSKTNNKGVANSDDKNSKANKESVSVIGEANMPIANSHVLEEILVRSDIHLQKSDLTLEEKLESLGLNTKSSTTSSTSSNLVPKANSMHTVLIQGLHTKDRTLLESCLEIKDITIIKNTVAHLPSSYVFSFLSFLVDKFQNKPSRIELVLWLRTVLLVHTSYLITIPDLVKALSPLYVTLDNRTNTFPKLLKLHGRLELLLAQVTPLASAGVETQQNAAVYEEEFSDDEEQDDEPMDNDEDEEEEDLMEEDDK